MKYRVLPAAMLFIIPMFILAIFGICFSLNFFLTEFGLKIVSDVIITILSLITALGVGYAFLDWFLDVLVIDKDGIRTIKWDGIIRVKEKYIKYEDIEETIIEQTFIQKILSLGDVTIYTAGQGEIKMNNLIHAHKLKDFIDYKI